MSSDAEASSGLMDPTRLPSFVLVTGNKNKLAEAERILGRELSSHAVDLPEIQSLDLEEVLLAKGEEAWRRLGRPLVVEETGLELDAMGGFPGPLVKWMLEAMEPEGIARAANALGNPRATARCALLYTDGECRIVAEGATSGRLVPTPRGTRGFGWDPVFVPDGCQISYAELSSAEKDRLGHRGRAWRALARRLAGTGDLHGG